MIVGAWNGNHFNRHIVKKAQTVNAVTRVLNFFRVKQRAFHLAYFSANHLIFGAAVATDIDVANVYALDWINGNLHIHCVVGHIEFGLHIDLRQSITISSQTRLYFFNNLAYFFTRVHAAQTVLNQFIQIGFGRTLGIADQSDAADVVLFTLFKGQGNVHAGFFRLCGFNIHVGDVKIQITTVIVVRANGFDIGF